MKNILLLLVVLFTTNFTNAQKPSQSKIKKANSEYEQFSFKNAIQKYENSELTDISEKRKLGLAYHKTGDLQNAEKLFKEVVEDEKHTSQDVYKYASLLREQGKYDSSIAYLNEFSQLSPSDSRGQAHQKNQNAHQKLLIDGGQFKVNNLNLNTDAQDFGTAFYKDQIVFASTRKKPKSVVRVWNWNQLPFLDTYVSKIDNGELVSLRSFSNKVNKKFHEGPVAFNQEGNMMIYTQNNYSEKSADKKIRLKMMQSQLVDSVWSKPIEIHFNSPNYSVGHPSISNDGKWLYFSSDMPGGTGGTDIYKASINPDGSIGEPFNLGSSINTEGNEMFPFIHSGNDLLFFASDGKVGLGGLDIFASKLVNGDVTSQIQNLGAPINSNRDDFAFILNPEQTSGYFSSNRSGGKGSDDIYGFEMLIDIKFEKIIEDIALIENNEVITEVDSIKDIQTDNIVQSNLANTQPKIDSLAEAMAIIPDPLNTSIEDTTKVTIIDNSEPSAKVQATTLINQNNKTDNSAISNEEISLYLLVSDMFSRKPIEGVDVTIKNNLTGEVERFTTSASGDFRKTLMNKKLNDKGSYLISLNKAGYFPKSGVYDIKFTKYGEYPVHEKLDLSMQKMKLLDLNMTQIDKLDESGKSIRYIDVLNFSAESGQIIETSGNKIIQINPIYFDLDKANIRPDAALELDKIVKVLNENPNYALEFGSHTDIRASNSYNQILSDQRAMSTAKYIKSRVSNPDRVNGMGYGETIPNIIDASADGGQNSQLLDEDFINTFQSKDNALYNKYHNYNRRTEFILIEIKK